VGRTQIHPQFLPSRYTFTNETQYGHFQSKRSRLFRVHTRHMTKEEKKFIPLFSRTRRAYTTKELEQNDRLRLASGPWKCKKCNIIFTDRSKATKHIIDTGFVKSISGDEPWRGNMTFFHIVVDRDGDDMMYPKEIHN
jgi:ribosomal protein L37AE/L43A